LASSEEEPYSTIFASLNHPVRRKILRMLSQNPMSFSEILDALGVSSSFLTYHIENLGELVGKSGDGKYRLSSFGEAAMATMTKVEDIPSNARHNGTRLTRFFGRTTVIALGIICIALAATVVGAFVYYVPLENKRNNTISFLNNQVAQLQDNISSYIATTADFQNQLNVLVNWSSSVENTILSNASAWVNKTVVLVGSMRGPLGMMADAVYADAYELNSSGQTIGLSFSASVNLSKSFYSDQYIDAAPSNGTIRVYSLNSSITVGIYGVIKEGEIVGYLNGIEMSSFQYYYLEAEEVEML
jgi:hypothetical protein